MALAVAIPLTIALTLAWAPTRTFDDWWLLLLHVGTVLGLPYLAIAVFAASLDRLAGLAKWTSGLAVTVLSLLMIRWWATQVTEWAETPRVQYGGLQDQGAFGWFLALAPAIGCYAMWVVQRERVSADRIGE